MTTSPELPTDIQPTTADSPVSAPEAAPRSRVGRGFLCLFGLLNFGMYLTVLMPALFSLPYKVQDLDPAGKTVSLGLVASIGAMVSLVAGPTAGVLSDRTRSRWGRRRPWLLGGIVIALLGSSVVAIAPNLGIVILGWVIVALGGAGTSAAVTPIVAERVPEQQRGTVGAIVGVATQLAGVLGYTIGGLLTGSLLLLFLLPWLLFGALAIAWVMAIGEEAVEVPRNTLREMFALMVFNPRKQRDFSLAWIGKLLMQVSLAFLTTYQLYFLGDRLGFTPEEAGQKLALVGGIGILVTMTFAVVSGMLSDKLGRRKVFIVVSSALAAVGMVLMAATDGFGLFLAAVLCILGSAGMFGSVDVAMASDLVPNRAQAGRWMTIYNLAATLPTALAPLMGSVLLTLGSTAGTNYTALFGVGAAVAASTGAVTLLVRGVR
ncbi:MFS transporter [Nocardia fusca]|uniref:MFS transporter n=1 Tax=Nocardia fusca TaxID=941183 RepID=A0ABV3FGU6_9NOCA